MSNVIEDRILQMKFDNSNFEKNVKQSLSSLDNLDKNLNKIDASKSAKSLNGLNSIDLSGIQSSLDTVRDRFSTLGVVGMTVIQNLTNTVVNGAKKMTSALTSAITQGGWNRSSNIQKAKFQLEGLGVAWENISEDIDYGVKDTAYGLDAAAVAASQLVASGVQYGEASEDMRKALRGISGVAAMTNSSYEDISRIYTTVAGQGRLMADQLNQLAARGLNAAAVLGNALGVSEAEIREMTSKGQIDFQTFSAAMDDAFGEHAKAANKTFTGALSNIKAALARTGQAFIMPAIANQDENSELKNLVDILNAIRVVINGVNSALAPLATKVEEVMHILSARVVDKIEKIFSKDADGNVVNDVITNPLKNAIDVIINFTRNLYIGLGIIKNSITKIIDIIRNAFSIVFPNTVKLSDIITDFSLRFRSFAGNISRFLRNSDFLTNLQSIAENVFKVIKVGFIGLKRTITTVVDIVRNAFSSIFPSFEKIGGSITNLLMSITDGLGKTITRFINSYLQDSSFISNLTSILKGLFAIIDIGATVFKNIFKIVKTGIEHIKPLSGGLIKNVVEFLARIGDFIVKIDNAIKGSDKFSEIIDKISEKFGKLIDIIKNIGKAFGIFISKLSHGIFDNLLDDTQKLTDKLHFFNVIENIANKLGPIFSKIGQGISFVVQKVGELLSSFFGNFSFERLLELMDQGFLAAIFVWLKKFTTVNTIDTTLRRINSTLFDFGLTLQKLQMKMNVENLFTFAKAIALLAGSLIALSFVDTDKLYSAVGALIELAGALTLIMEVLFGVSSATFGQAMTGIADAFAFKQKMIGVRKFAAAILLLSVALKIISTIESEKLLESVLVLSIVIGELIIASNLLSKNESGMLKGAGALIPFAMGIVILAMAFKIFATMSWGEMIKGMAGFTVIIGSVVGASIALSKTGSSMLKGAAGMIPFAIGIVILAAAFKIFATMSWEELAKGMASLVVALGVITGMTIALNKVAGNGALIAIGAGLLVFSAGLTVLAAAMKIFASMSWEELAKGMASLVVALGVITAMTIALKLTAGASALAAVGGGLVVFSLGLAILLPVLRGLASMSWGDLAKIGAALAGLFVILGLAGYILKPVIPTILSLSGALALFGVACLLAGAGILMLGMGLSAIGASLGVIGAGLLSFITNIAKIIPSLVNVVAGFLEGLLKTIINLIGIYAPQLLDAAVVLIETLCRAILKAAPIIIETLISLLDMLAENIVPITEKATDVAAKSIITIINKLAEHIPEFIKAIANFLQSLFGAIGEVLGGMNFGDIALAVAELAAATLMLAFVGQTGPAALWGILIMTAVVAALGLLLTGLGALVKYVPEVKEFLAEGIPILAMIGQAIGEFAGNLIGGLLGGMSSALPIIASNLSEFAVGLQPMIDIFSKIDPSVGDGAASLALALLALTGAELVHGLANFISGGTGFQDLIQNLVPFGEAMVEFAATVKGIQTDDVESAANAGKMLAEMAATIPNSGGVAGFFAGNNDLDAFTEMIGPFGEAIVSFSDAVKDIQTDGVEKATIAGKMITEMAATIPNSGGVAGFFAGNNDLDDFAEMVGPFGEAIVSFSDAVKDIQTDGVEKATIAGKMLIEMANTIPNSGGVVGFFAGNNDLDDFAAQIIPFAQAIKGYSDTITQNGGIKTQAVLASTLIGQALAGIYNSLKDKTDVFGLFTGVSSMDVFSSGLKKLGTAIKDYCGEIQGMSTDSATIESSIVAIDALAVIYNNLKDKLDVFGLFTGVSSMDNFSSGLKKLGTAIKDYCGELEGIEADSAIIDSSTVVIDALAEIYNKLKGKTDLFSIFTGVSTLDDFSSGLKKLGGAIKDYSTELPSNLDDANITASISVVTALAGLYDAVDETGGLFDIFTGVKDMPGFASGLKELGGAIKDYSDSVSGTKFDDALSSVPVITGLVDAIVAIPSDVQVTNFITLSDNLSTFADSLKDFSDKMKSVSTVQIESAATSINSIINLLNNLNGGSASSNIYAFSDALTELANSGVKDMASTFENADITSQVMTFISNAVASLESEDNQSKFEGAGTSLMNRFKDAIETADTYSSAASAGKNAAVALHNLYDLFYDAGVWSMEGYIQGMYSRSDSVYSMGYALGQRAYEAAKEAVDSSSPSKKFMELGGYNAEGFALGMRQSFGIVDAAASDMGEVSLETIRNIIGGIASMIESDMDCNPTIRPVLDTSDIQNGIGYINGALNSSSFSFGGVSGRLGNNIGMVRTGAQAQTPTTYSNPVYNVNIDVTASPGMNEQELARAIMDRARIELHKEEAVWA